MSPSENSPIRERVRAALQLSYIADSLAMPVHWYYNPADIFNAFPGGIQALEAAPQLHPMSFMSLKSANDETGKIEVVGDLILKGKRKFWNIPNEHVHQGMKAGDNTLNAHCARLVTRTLAGNAGRYDADKFLDAYIAFMTADIPQHPDTYAELYHRGFFANLANGVPRTQCGVSDDEPMIGGLATIAPIAIVELLHDRNLVRVQAVCRQHLFLTHPLERLGVICAAYVELIDALLFRAADQPPQPIIARIARQSANIDVEQLSSIKDDNEVVGGQFSKACPIDDSWPGVLHFAYKYNDQPKSGLLANTNVGGENCHRGIVLGILLGLSTADGLDNLFTRLADKEKIQQEIDALDVFDASTAA